MDDRVAHQIGDAYALPVEGPSFDARQASASSSTPDTPSGHSPRSCA
jgi:hypothetical protein